MFTTSNPAITALGVVVIEWVESRRVDDEGGELFFVEATESGRGWSFRERSTWESRWYESPSNSYLLLVADQAKQAWMAGAAVLGWQRIVVAEAGGCHLEEFRNRPSTQGKVARRVRVTAFGPKKIPPAESAVSRPGGELYV